MASRGTVLTFLLLAGLAPGRAEACSVAPNPAFEVDLAEAAIDTEAPGAIPAIEITVGRGKGPQGCGASSCDDLGTITLTITPPADDRTAPTELAYRVRLVEGHVPGHLLDHGELEGVWLSNYESHGVQLYFNWVDGAEDVQEPLGFTLEVAPVDKAGNEGPATTVVVVHGGEMRGCSIGGVPVPFAALMMLVTIAIVGTARLARTRWARR